MQGEIRIFLGPNEEDNLEAYDTLRQLRGIKVIPVNGVSQRDKYVPMPYIEDEDGLRYYGLVSIQRFVAKKLGIELGSTQ